MARQRPPRSPPRRRLKGPAMNDTSDLAELQSDPSAAEPRRESEFRTVDPATGQPGRAYHGHSPEEAHEAAAAAKRAQQSWRRTSFEARGAAVRKAAAILREREDEFAALMTEEMGKTLDEGRAEVEKCAF